MATDEARLNTLLQQSSPFTDEQLDDRIGLMSQPTNSMLRPYIFQWAQTRLALEQMKSIRCFDKASGKLVETTNRLTIRILSLTVLAVFLAFVSVVATAWPCLTWWFSNGFRLH